MSTKETGFSPFYSDMNPTRKITAEDLEDGSLLEASVAPFNTQRNEQNLTEILEILRLGWSLWRI